MEIAAKAVATPSSPDYRFCREPRVAQTDFGTWALIATQRGPPKASFDPPPPRSGRRRPEASAGRLWRSGRRWRRQLAVIVRAPAREAAANDCADG